MILSLALLALLAPQDGKTTLSGRATVLGEPAQRATLWLYDECLSEQVEGRHAALWVDEVEVFGCGSIDPYWLTRPRAELELLSDGRFEIGSLPEDDYRLVIETAAGDRIALDPLEVGPGARTELGDVALAPACHVRGRVLLREGRSTEGWTVTTCYLTKCRTAPLDAEGRFLFEELNPTLHRFHVRAPDNPFHPVIVARYEQRIAPGEVAAIEIDARGSGCQLELDVRVRGAPIKGVTVALAPLGPISAPCRLGPSDADGRIRAWSTTLGQARAELISELNLPVGSAKIENALRQSQNERRTLEVPAARLIVEWPAEARWEQLTRVELSGSEQGEVARRFSVSLDLVNQPHHRARLAADAPRCDLGHIAPGRYEVMLRLFSNTGHVADYRRTVDVPDAPEFVCAFAARDSR